MTPPTVNAGYNPSENNINFPAGILQPPFFDKTMDDAVNFGAIGAVIGHELTHGFDDEGRQVRRPGQPADWWTAADAKEFEKRAACIADQYSGFTVVGGRAPQRPAHPGREHRRQRRPAHRPDGPRGHAQGAPAAADDDGFTPEQRFFLGWGADLVRELHRAGARLRAQTDPHSPGRYRVNGVVSNMPEFQKAFNCPAKAPMVRENACRVW